MGIYHLRDERSKDISKLEQDYYMAHIRREEFFSSKFDPLFKEFQKLLFVNIHGRNTNKLYRFWGQVMCLPILYEYRDGGISSNWVELNTVEHMYILPGTNLPIWVMKDGLDPRLKDVVVGRLSGRVYAEHRQDYVDRYRQLSNRSGRLSRIVSLFRDMLVSRIECLAYKLEHDNKHYGKVFSIKLNGRVYFWTRDIGLVNPWNIEELVI